MIELDIAQLVALMGIPSAITGLCFWRIQRRLTKRDEELDRRDAAGRETRCCSCAAWGLPSRSARPRPPP